LRPRLPYVAVVDFYEGNDLNNNLTFLERRLENPDAGSFAAQAPRHPAGRVRQRKLLPPAGH
jgi:hypothetical protein